MEASLDQCNQAENDEEYILLDLENVCMQGDIPANAPYTLSAHQVSDFSVLGIVGKIMKNSTTFMLTTFDESCPGLDTLNPTLTIGNRLKLIGEYQETIGTCIMFCERDDETAVKNTEIGSSDGRQRQADDLNKQFRDVASVHKVLKFRLEADVQTENAL